MEQVQGLPLPVDQYLASNYFALAGPNQFWLANPGRGPGLVYAAFAGLMTNNTNQTLTGRNNFFKYCCAYY